MSKTRKLIQQELENLPWCHIYGQRYWHAEVVIEGTRDALMLLRNAIGQALHTGRDVNSGSLFVADGEGYHVTVKIRNHGYLEQRPLPYTADFTKTK